MPHPSPHPRTLRFTVLEERYAICRLPAESPLPPWPPQAELYCCARTGDELSVVCARSLAPAGAECSAAYACLKLTGPFALTEVGVLASFVAPLAEEGVAVFVVSTYDTDYVLVAEQRLEDALLALRRAGHHPRAH